MKNIINVVVATSIGAIVGFSFGVFGGIKYMDKNFDVGLKHETMNDPDVIYVRRFLRKYTTMK